jgi:hypothetical protein
MRWESPSSRRTRIIFMWVEDNPSLPPLTSRGGEYFPLRLRGIEGVIFLGIYWLWEHYT